MKDSLYCQLKQAEIKVITALTHKQLTYTQKQFNLIAKRFVQQHSPTKRNVIKI